jgi:hypothetical protein
VGCGPAGGLPVTFAPWSQPVYPAPQPYRPPQVVRPAAAAPRPQQPARPAALVAAAPTKPAIASVTVPPPEQLGITLSEPAVVVPEPAKLGITLE